MLIVQFGLEVRDRLTDRQTDITTYRAAIAAKNIFEFVEHSESYECYEAND